MVFEKFALDRVAHTDFRLNEVTSETPLHEPTYSMALILGRCNLTLPQAA